MSVRPALKRNAISLQRLKPTVGFAASLLAVWCQILLLATISLSPLDISAGPVDDVPICHADDGTGPAQQKPDHPTHDCVLCVICLSHASAPSLLSPGPTLPERQSAPIVRLEAPYPRAPPIQLTLAPQPRGPPSLI
jgi:hypothetical protein